MNKIRDSRFELLRIVAIVSIVLYHFCLHTATGHLEGDSVNGILFNLYHIGGKFGVDLFVLITGYFSVRSTFRLRKVADLELQMLFYTLTFLVIYLVCVGMHIYPLSLKMVIRSVMPTTFSAYWFVTTYIAMYLVSPFINLVARKLTTRQYAFLLLICFLMFSFVPTFMVQRQLVNYLLFFIFLYFVGGFIRLNREKIARKLSVTMLRVLAVGSLLFLWLSAVGLELMKSKISVVVGHETYFHFEYSVPILLLAVSVFLLMERRKEFESPAVNRIAKTTFGVYLIQSNPIVATYMLWPWLESLELYNASWWWIAALAVTAAITVMCMVIERGRLFLFEKFCLAKLYALCDKVDKRFHLDQLPNG